VSALEVVRAISLPFALAGVLLVATRRRLVRKLQKAQAYDDRSAVALPASFPLQAWWQSRLKVAGVLKVTGSGRCWLDRAAWQQYRAVRRRRGLTIVACAALGVAVVLVLRLRWG